MYGMLGLGSPTRLIRRIGGYDNRVDYGSGGYTWGNRGGQAWEFLAESAFGTAAWGGLGGNVMKVMVGPGAPSHVLYEVGGQILHGGGTQKGEMIVSAVDRAYLRMIRSGRWSPWFTFEVPIRNLAGASAVGHSAYNCIDAAWQAMKGGWRF